MNENTVTGDFININLRQLGATSIKEYNSIMHIAEFDLGDGLIVSYVFNITRHNKYFLQRVQALCHDPWQVCQRPRDPRIYPK